MKISCRSALKGINALSGLIKHARNVNFIQRLDDMRYFILATIIMATIAFAHIEIKSPENTISDMMKTQNVSSTKEISCDKLSANELEELGDAVMERMTGGHDLHEQMDAMMGGEGSASLKQMHITMGSNWLGCTNLTMTHGMMQPMMMRMMGNYYPGYYNGYDMAVFAAVVGWVLLGAAVIYMHSSRKKRR